MQIRHLGFKTISRSFDTKEDAEEFLKKAQNIVAKKIRKRQDEKAFNKLKGNYVSKYGEGYRKL